MPGSIASIDLITARAYPAFMDGREACAKVGDPDAFFSIEEGARAAAAKICMRCPLREPCLEWALETRQEFGVLGGKTPAERRKIRRGGGAA